MRKILLALAVIVTAVAVAACGGHPHKSAHVSSTTNSATTTPAPTPAPSNLGFPCNPDNYAMQCNGKAAEAAPKPTLGSSPAFRYGTDTYTSGNPFSASDFNCSYIPLAGKGWSASGLSSWHVRGKPTCIIFEQGATQAEDGYGEGQANARYALSEANAIGVPSYAAIFFAVDTDASGASVAPYFQGVHSILGSRTGAYGSYFVINTLLADHLITTSTAWQTLAWSQGLVGPACLYQRAIPEMAGTFLDGAWVDLDIAKCANWGQFPQTAPPKPPKPVNPHHYKWLPNVKRAFKVKAGKHTINVHAREREAAQQFDKAGCVLNKKSHHFTRKVCKTHARNLRLLGGRLWTLAHKSKNLKHTAKKARWGASHYKGDKHTTTLGGAYRQMHRRTVAKAPIKSW